MPPARFLSIHFHFLGRVQSSELKAVFRIEESPPRYTILQATTWPLALFACGRRLVRRQREFIIALVKEEGAALQILTVPIAEICTLFCARPLLPTTQYVSSVDEEPKGVACIGSLIGYRDLDLLNRMSAPLPAPTWRWRMMTPASESDLHSVEH